MIKLIKSAFYNEKETRATLSRFVVEAEMLSMGEQCRTFELAFAKSQERSFAVFVGSGSAANLVLIQAMMNLGQFKRGDVIGVSALTWATNIMPLIQLGLVPLPLDCSLETLNTSPQILEPALKKMRGLFLTNVLGFCDQLNIIAERCREANVVLLEDNCESLGSRMNGRLLGNFGLASTFSFFIGHHMSTIEGGMICTDDPELYDMLVLVRAHGWDRNLSEGSRARLRSANHIDDFFAKYTFYDLAYNARPSEINGFLGNTQLPYLPAIVERRQKNFARFHTAAAKNSDVAPLRVEHMDRISNFAMPLVFRDEATFTKYRETFRAEDVEIRPIIAGDMTQQPFYKKYFGEQVSEPNANRIHRQGLYFGNNPDMTEEEISTLCRIVSGAQ